MSNKRLPNLYGEYFEYILYVDNISSSLCHIHKNNY